MKSTSYPSSVHLPTPDEAREQKETGNRTPAQGSKDQPAPAEVAENAEETPAASHREQASAEAGEGRSSRPPQS